MNKKFRPFILSLTLSLSLHTDYLPLYLFSIYLFLSAFSISFLSFFSLYLSYYSRCLSHLLLLLLSLSPLSFPIFSLSHFGPHYRFLPFTNLSSTPSLSLCLDDLSLSLSLSLSFSLSLSVNLETDHLG